MEPAVKVDTGFAEADEEAVASGGDRRFPGRQRAPEKRRRNLDQTD
jgi:hypothetical protein